MGETGGTNYTGLQLWVGGLLLASFLAENGCSLRGRKVVELGCGISPLPALVAALSGAASCTATDGYDDVLVTTRSNVKLNASRALVERLDWEAKVAAAAAGSTHRWDVVIFGDCVYSVEGGHLLAQCINATVAPGGEVLGALCPLRVGTAEFVLEMQNLGFSAKEMQLNPSTLAAIEDGSVLGLGTQSVLQCETAESMICGRPVKGCTVVRWQKGAVAGDESRKIWDKLAGILREAEDRIRLSEGFEIWE